MNTDLLEKLAALEHEQWSFWTRHFLENQTPENLARWRQQAGVAYEQLDESDKDKDRDWARKALQILHSCNAGSDILYEGQFLRILKKGRWEYVERRKTSGIVGILAITAENKILLVEQFRPPLGKQVIELPAGLAGDIPGSEHEALAVAAQRELLEETGYEAGTMRYLTEGPASAGLSTEIITFFHALDVKKVEAGGGDAGEAITVHEVPLAGLELWLQAKRNEGILVDYKIYAALGMLNPT
jgi:ADP-ribose pyrophosphatase